MGVVGGNSPAGGAGNILRVVLLQQLLGLVIAGGVLQVWSCIEWQTPHSYHLQDVREAEYVEACLLVRVAQDTKQKRLARMQSSAVADAEAWQVIHCTFRDCMMTNLQIMYHLFHLGLQ